MLTGLKKQLAIAVPVERVGAAIDRNQIETACFEARPLSGMAC
jgi:hypothetical protein